MPRCGRWRHVAGSSQELLAFPTTRITNEAALVAAAEQQIDYLATDDLRYYAQVYLHAVPAAEVVTPPQYCEWTGSGWTCTPIEEKRSKS